MSLIWLEELLLLEPIYEKQRITLFFRFQIDFTGEADKKSLSLLVS